MGYLFNFIFISLIHNLNLIILGLSVGDDLGFPESLTNVESNKRRSVSARSTGNSVGVLSAAEQQVNNYFLFVQLSIKQVLILCKFVFLENPTKSTGCSHITKAS